MKTNTIGDPFQTVIEDDYWNKDPRYAHQLDTVNVTAPAKAPTPAPAKNTWLWAAIGLGAATLFLTNGKRKR